MKVCRSLLWFSKIINFDSLPEIITESRKDLYEGTQTLVARVLRVSIFILTILPITVVFLSPIVYIIIDLYLGRYSPEKRKFPMQI